MTHKPLYLLALVALSAGCLTLDTDVPIEQCSRGEALPESEELSKSCRDSLETQLKESEFDAYVVLRDDQQVLYRWGDVDLPHNVASVRKSIVSLLFGIASERGLVDLDATLEEIGVGDSAEPLSQAEQQATIRHLLQARSGVYIEPLGEPRSWRELRPARGSYAPGERWFYNNWDFNALGTIFESTTGMTLQLAFEQWLAEPLGMQTYCREHVIYESAEFTEHDMYRFYMSASDLARLGMLVLQDGQWRGEQIVSKAWIDESTRPVSEVREVRPDSVYKSYGYLWWIDDEGHIWADGSGGQFIHINRQAGLVTVARNQTGISVPGRLWYGIAQSDDLEENDIYVDEPRIHKSAVECL